MSKEIKTFKDLFDKLRELYEVEKTVLDDMERGLKFESDKTPEPTELQKTVFNHPCFDFDDKRISENRNLIIQGATSSGKTLIAEILALEYIYRFKKVIYLVPLKALASEKVNQFKKDLCSSGQKFKIYASSSDYQDHDEDLMSGNYHVAVIVYEKFYALLADQRCNKFLNECGLIIVDEIQYISTERGPKLEYSLVKVMHQADHYIRIMGLTTIDCDVKKLQEWLKDKNGDSAVIIANPSRPVKLEEYIISYEDGSYKHRTNSISTLGAEEGCENKCEGDFKKFFDKSVSIEEKLGGIEKLEQKKEKFLGLLLEKLLSENNEKKAIVFVNSRSRCRSIAKVIAKHKWSSEQNDKLEDFESYLNKFDNKNIKDVLKNELLPNGVAYHNAELSMSLRNKIEEDFKSNDGLIRILVATETITIGMNMPADVMIIYDDTVYRGGSNQAVPISLQDYRNYIGRAGRLGLSNSNGESYLLVKSTDLRRKWHDYIESSVEEISSALDGRPNNKVLLTDCAPYFLNLLSGRNYYTKKDIQACINWIFLSKQNRESLNDIVDILLKGLEKLRLVKQTESDGDIFSFDTDNKNIYYKNSEYGNAMAPYALSMRTCQKINEYFHLISNNESCLPSNYTGVDLQEKKKYLLDILFTVCSMEEVRRFPSLRVPAPNDDITIYQKRYKAIINFLKAYREKQQEAFWDGSKLEIIADDNGNVDIEEYTAAYRAILLYFWLEGKLVSSIVSEFKEGSGQYIFESDLERLGETSSFILEAIGNSFVSSNERIKLDINISSLQRSFKALASRIKYGLNDSTLLRIAKRQIPGVERADLIRLKMDAIKAGYKDSVLMFIKQNEERCRQYFNVEQLDSLREHFRYRNDVSEMLAKTERFVKDTNMDEKWFKAFKNITLEGDSGNNGKAWIENLKTVLNLFGAIKPAYIKTKQVPGLCVGEDLNIWCAGKEYCLVCLQKEYQTNEVIQSIKYSFENTKKYIFVLNKDMKNLDCDCIPIFIISRFAFFCIQNIGELKSDQAERLLGFFFENINVYSKVLDKFSEIMNNLLDKLSYIVDKDSSNPRNEYDIVDVIDEKKNIYVIKLKTNDTEEKDAKKVLKVLHVPCNDEEYKLLVDKADKFYQKLHDQDEGRWKEELANLCAEKDAEQIFNRLYSKIPVILTDKEERLRYFVNHAVVYIQAYGLLREVKIPKKLDSPHVVRIDCVNIEGDDKEKSYKDTQYPEINIEIIMDKKDGSLEDLLSDKERFEKKDICDIGRKMCVVLCKLQENKIIHQDIKPSNILYKQDNLERYYYLTDFGCAKCVGETSLGGTPAYAAPEIRTGDYDYRVDIYSLGKTLWRLYTHKHYNSKWQEESYDATYDKRLLEVLEKACQENVADRYADAEDFYNALKDL